MRQPAVADRFYPGSPEALARAIAEISCRPAHLQKTKALAVVSPHAGYVYSGALAAETFSSVVIPGNRHHYRPQPSRSRSARRPVDRNLGYATGQGTGRQGDLPISCSDHSQPIKIDETGPSNMSIRWRSRYRFCRCCRKT